MKSNEGGRKKTFRKKTFHLFSEKLLRATKNKNIGQISGKVNDGDEIKKLTYFK